MTRFDMTGSDALHKGRPCRVVRHIYHDGHNKAAIKYVGSTFAGVVEANELRPRNPCTCCEDGWCVNDDNTTPRTNP